MHNCKYAHARRDMAGVAKSTLVLSQISQFSLLTTVHADYDDVFKQNSDNWRRFFIG